MQGFTHNSAFLRPFCYAIVGFISFNAPFNTAHATAKTIPSIQVSDGQIPFNAVMTDPDGTIFIEFLSDTFLVESGTQSPMVEGEILPPQLIAEPAPNPRSFTKELLTFELFTSNFRDYAFTNKERRRSKQVKLLYMKPDWANEVVLWKWNDETEKWSKVGGTTITPENSTDELFTVFLSSTGVYGLYDHAPSPNGDPDATPTPIRDEDIEYALPNPAPTALTPAEKIQWYQAQITAQETIAAEQKGEPVPEAASPDGDEEMPETEENETNTPPPLGEPDAPSDESIIDDPIVREIIDADDDLRREIEDIIGDEIPTPDRPATENTTPIEVPVVPPTETVDPSIETPDAAEEIQLERTPVPLPNQLPATGQALKGLGVFAILLAVLGLMGYSAWAAKKTSEKQH